jgi:hypothetical protein
MKALALVASDLVVAVGCGAPPTDSWGGAFYLAISGARELAIDKRSSPSTTFDEMQERKSGSRVTGP